MQPADIYRYFAPLGIAGIWLTCGIILKRGFSGKSISMSLHAADSRRRFVFFGLGLTFNAICFYIFAAKWLTPIYHLPAAFMVLFTLTIIGQLITAWVPDTKGLQHKVHITAAYGFSSCLPFITAFLFLSPYATTALKITSALATLTMAGLILAMMVSKKVRAHHLTVQIVYALVIHVTLLVAAFAV